MKPDIDLDYYNSIEEIQIETPVTHQKAGSEKRRAKTSKLERCKSGVLLRSSRTVMMPAKS